MASNIRRSTALNALGVIVLLAGLGIGGFYYRQSLRDSPPTDGDVLAFQEQSKVYDQTVQRNVGAFGLLMTQWSDALARLGAPRPLAGVSLLVSSALAGGLFLAASRRRQ